MQSLQKLESECLTYFKSEPVWRKVLAGFLEKYASFGKFTGKVQLKNLSADEIEVLEGFSVRIFMEGKVSPSVQSALQRH